MISPSNVRGGDNSIVLQKLYDQCLKNQGYVQVNDDRVKKIIRKMLGITIQANKPIIVSTSVYFLAILKTRHAPLILQKGGTKLIIQNFPGFMSRGVGSLALGAVMGSIGIPLTVLVPSLIPLVLIGVIYANLHINCKSFVDPLPTIEGNLQYIGRVANDNDPPIIVAPTKNKPEIVYQKFDESEISSFTSLRCYVEQNCLGSEPIQRKSSFYRKSPFKANIGTQTKNKKYVPLSQRTKTLKDLPPYTHIDAVDAIDVENIKFKE